MSDVRILASGLGFPEGFLETTPSTSAAMPLRSGFETS